MTATPLLCIRADAGPDIGAGHVMRCLALAQAWQARGGEAVFVGRIASDRLAARIEYEGFAHMPHAPGSEAEDIRATLEMLDGAASGAAWLALDGYGFGPSWQDALRETPHRLLVLDDTASLEAYAADVVLNQNIFARQGDYPAPPATLVLAGLRFALLREEFTALPCRPAEPEAATEILVTMGAGDPDNVTATVLEGLARAGSSLRVTVVAGPANPHRAELERMLAQGPLRGEVITADADMADRMRRAHLCVSAAGSTCWELACVGAPSLLITVADNQRGIAAGLAEAGAALDLGGHADLTPERVAEALSPLLGDAAARTAMSSSARHLVDGKGAERVAGLMAAMSGARFSVTRHLRPVRPDDARALWRLANDPDLRANSFSPEPIPWEDHQGWFARKMASPDTRIHLLEIHGVPAGFIRHDLEGGQAVIDYCVAPAFRGLRLGERLLTARAAEVCRDLGAKGITGAVRTNNAPSLRCFQRAGFDRGATETVDGVEYVRFRLSRPEELDYVVVSSRPWNRPVFDHLARHLPGRWHYVERREDLTPGTLERIKPRYIFFLHWSWIVDEAVTSNHECVCFHMTDVPYGRGGSPLQNLIVRDHAGTMLTALRMERGLDTGPVYAKLPLDLAGPARAIYERASWLAADIVARMVAVQPRPEPQQGEPEVFSRRTPEQSELPPDATPRAVYDHIRMLDADGYPRAFARHGRLRFEFEKARIRKGEVVARVSITSRNQEGEA
ncbi:UDP-2,4-diacetamido-2,4,6-trideoxy-beta-L-altropyranose hydrolase [Desulfohalovibrio reitneri]|uniref:UDP-2,4-diacetamido-2,4, 6-trideoxy-beta-L-altropyranose hydrolase n=1 Tax=Desulfohalovibrio reitneri TaxID=1307759 RepID=UPI0009E019AB|nr:UDP-2,4-diacetamido-2,4,6-trideoxy-beta-L-altropyranose hydrolase [Desulfohalovibrio reitneri]